MFSKTPLAASQPLSVPRAPRSTVPRFWAQPSTRALLLIAAVAALCFLGLAYSVRSHRLLPIDAMPVLLFFHGHATLALNGLAQAASDGVTVVSVAVFLSLLLRRRWRFALFWLAATGGGVVLGNMLKRWVGRLRPDFLDVIAPQHSFALPSGHALHSMAILLAALLIAQSIKTRKMIAASGVVFVLLIGAARVYLGQHYPSDILGGWAVASAWVCLIGALFRYSERK